MSRSKFVFLVIVAALLVTGSAFAQQTATKVEKAEVEIVYVSGNTVVYILDGKVQQREMPADFKIDVGGQMVPLSALKPGQKVMVERTTTTTVLPPEKVVTVRNGEVLQVVGNTLMYREDGQSKKVTPPKDFKFIVDGKHVGIGELRPGMKLTATIVKEKEVAPVTKTALKASADAPKPAAPAPAAAAPAPAPAPAAAPAPAPAAEPAKKKMPKTATPLPLVGLAGGALFLLGAGVSALRRRRAA
jgi:outer membrane lipoprotein-sorting protein